MQADKQIQNQYVEGVGRRKESVARVRISPSKKTEITVNGRKFQEYFPVEALRHSIMAIFEKAELKDHFSVSVKVIGGGIASQADALRHGLARALVRYRSDLRPIIKKLGYLTRDARVKERRKFGLKKARRAPQWSKR